MYVNTFVFFCVSLVYAILSYWFKEHRLFIYSANHAIRLHAIAWCHILSQFIHSSLILWLHVKSMIPPREMPSHNQPTLCLFASYKRVYSIVWPHIMACYNQFILAKYSKRNEYVCMLTHLFSFVSLLSTQSFILTLNNIGYLFLVSIVQYKYMHQRDVALYLNLIVLF